MSFFWSTSEKQAHFALHALYIHRRFKPRFSHSFNLNIVKFSVCLCLMVFVWASFGLVFSHPSILEVANHLYFRTTWQWPLFWPSFKIVSTAKRSIIFIFSMCVEYLQLVIIEINCPIFYKIECFFVIPSFPPSSSIFSLSRLKTRKNYLQHR